MVTATAYDAGYSSLSAMRAKMAGDKELALKVLARQYRRVEGGPRVAQSLFAAAKAFGRARRSVRNELFHAHPFTAGIDEEGAYLPGLGHTTRDGRSFRTLARTPADLLDLSETVEQAIDSLAYARTLVRGTAAGTGAERLTAGYGTGFAELEGLA